MRKLIATALLLAFGIHASAQDTVVVQTLEFSDITKRRGWYAFPPDTGSYQKIIMQYTLKCDPQTTQDGFDCGEWDYTTYTNLFHYEGFGTPYYVRNNVSPDTIRYASAPWYDIHQSYQYHIVYDAVNSETDVVVGSGANANNNVLASSRRSGKSQYIWTAAELGSAGLTAGTIDKLRLDVATLGDDLQGLRVRVKHSMLTELTEASHETTGFTEVYHLNTSFAATGLQDLNFTTPFTWDGTSNLVVEFSFSNNQAGSDNEVVTETQSFSAGVFATMDDGYIDVENPDYVEVPVNDINTNITDQVTISFWQYGDPEIQPSKTFIFQANDSNDRRVMSSHLPWDNGKVFWDCGNSGTSSYDRIDKQANPADYEGQWNHWAYTKDVSTGVMNIYLNGQLWHTGTGMTRTISDIRKFVIAGGATGNGYGRYDGDINEFRIWNVALDATTIQGWMYKDVDGSHPNFSNLVVNLKFDDGAGLVASDEVNSDGQLIGCPGWRWMEGVDLYRNMAATMERPNLVFVQGDYTTHLDSTLVSDTVWGDQVSVLEFIPTRNMSGTGVSMVAQDTAYGYASGWYYTYDHTGAKVDSVFHTADQQLINQYSTTKVQIQNFVTPYGINLDLGPAGFRWEYDVTDYEPWLHDTLDIAAGNQQELIDLKFLFITGTPPHEVLNADVIWNGDYQHADIADDVVLPAVDVPTNAAASRFVVKTRTTGHWFGGFNNCAEFCPKYHNLKIDGSMASQWLNWTECALNPVYPQGGTWIYDRAGWCPGAFGDTYDHNISALVTPGNDVSIDYGMEPYPNGGGEGNYRTSVMFFQYSAPNFTVDASIDGIISPNNWDYRRRVNPICGNAKVIIKNTGSTPLTSVDIKYHCVWGAYKTFTWTGNLSFLDTAHVVLPINDASWWGPSNIFEVSVENPNGVADEYAGNNTMRAEFDAPPVYPNEFMIWYKANVVPSETSWYIKDEQGNVVYSRTSSSINALNKDTIQLSTGCYTLEVLDSDDDGLSFFANNDGTGYVHIRSMVNGLLKSFSGDFGRSIVHQFTVGYQTVGTEERLLESFMYVYPNPSEGKVKMELDGFSGDEILVTVVNALGQEVKTFSTVNTHQMMIEEIDLTGQRPGMYYVRVQSGDETRVQKLVLK